MVEPTMQEKVSHKLSILQHALGLDAFGRGNQFRNHFVTGPGSNDFPPCRELVAEGLMQDMGSNALTGGDTCFVVTRDGKEFVSKNSPTPPPEKILTRDQKRYRDYLRSDGSESFGDWLKHRWYARV